MESRTCCKGKDYLATLLVELFAVKYVIGNIELYTITKDARKDVKVTKDWKEAQLVIIFKKGDIGECGTYCGI